MIFLALVPLVAGLICIGVAIKKDYEDPRRSAPMWRVLIGRTRYPGWGAAGAGLATVGFGLLISR